MGNSTHLGKTPPLKAKPSWRSSNARKHSNTGCVAHAATTEAPQPSVTTRESQSEHAKSLQLCLAFCNPIHCSFPSSPVCGISQPTILEWVAMPSSRASSWPRDQTCIIYVTCWQMNYLPLDPNWDAHKSDQFSSVAQSCLFVTPWTAAHQASVFITNTQSLLKFMSIESVMPSNHLILCHPLLLLPSIFPSISLFKWANSLHQEAKVLEIQLQHQSSGLISFRMDWLDLFAVHGILKSLL